MYFKAFVVEFGSDAEQVANDASKELNTAHRIKTQSTENK